MVKVLANSPQFVLSAPRPQDLVPGDSYQLPNGTIIDVDSVGNVTRLLPDGTETTTYSDGVRVREDADGTRSKTRIDPKDIFVPTNLEAGRTYSLSEHFHLLPQRMKPTFSALRRSGAPVTFRVAQAVTANGIPQYQFSFRMGDTHNAATPSEGMSGSGAIAKPKTKPHRVLRFAGTLARGIPQFGVNVGSDVLIVVAIDKGVSALIEGGVLPKGSRIPAVLAGFYLTHQAFYWTGIASKPWSWKNIGRTMPAIFVMARISQLIFHQAGVDPNTPLGEYGPLLSSILVYESGSLAIRTLVNKMPTRGRLGALRRAGPGAGAVARGATAAMATALVVDAIGEHLDSEDLSDRLWKNVAWKTGGGFGKAVNWLWSKSLKHLHADSYSNEYRSAHWDFTAKTHDNASRLLQMYQQSMVRRTRINLARVRHYLRRHIGVPDNLWASKDGHAKFKELNRKMDIVRGMLDKSNYRHGVPMMGLFQLLVRWGIKPKEVVKALGQSIDLQWWDFKDDVWSMYKFNKDLSKQIKPLYKAMRMVVKSGSGLAGGIKEKRVLKLFDQDGTMNVSYAKARRILLKEVEYRNQIAQSEIIELHEEGIRVGLMQKIDGVVHTNFPETDEQTTAEQMAFMKRYQGQKTIRFFQEYYNTLILAAFLRRPENRHCYRRISCRYPSRQLHN